jgi:hypothetical protein
VVSAAAVLTTSLLAACAPAAPVPPTATVSSAAVGALPPGVSAALTQLRSDVADRQAQVRFRNDGSVAFTIDAVAVTDARLDGEAQATADRAITLKPGRSVIVRIQLPAVRCPASGGSGASGSDAAASKLRVDYRLGDAPAAAARVPIGEEFAFLDDFHARECLSAGLEAAADVTLASFTPSPPGEPAALVLRVVPRGASPAAEIVAIRETNLLSYEGTDAAASPLGIVIGGAADAATASVDVTLPLVPARCDPHAVQEDKRGTVFTLDVRVDGVDGTVQRAADVDMRAAILAWVTRWCGYGG